MCFVLYIAAHIPLPIVPWNDQRPALHTEPLAESHLGVASHFRLPHIYYVGSDKDCGCGYRHAVYQDGSWPEEEWRPEDDLSHIEAQTNHEALVEFARRNLAGESTFELYGAWEGDPAAPALSDQTIDLDRILDLNFYFRDGGYYTVMLHSSA
jgi:hypothetical protein